MEPRNGLKKRRNDTTALIAATSYSVAQKDAATARSRSTSTSCDLLFLRSGVYFPVYSLTLATVSLGFDYRLLVSLDS